MNSARTQSAFTLVELLVVLLVLTLLTSLVVPSVVKVRDMGCGISCRNNLRVLGKAMGLYHSENRGDFWPCTMYNRPKKGVTTYFWGTATDPVEPTVSPFVKAGGIPLSAMWCPKQPWGTYVPQGNVSEPTSNYGYNAWCLDPPSWRRRTASGEPMRTKKRSDIVRANQLFVFADSAMYWAPGGVDVLQNSTHLEPVTGTWSQNPTTHFRHDGRVNALRVDGAAESYSQEGWKFGKKYEKAQLGFVGDSNLPDYDQ